MIKTKRRFNEDDVVWFVDACFNKAGVEEFYAEHGKVLGFRKNGDVIVSFFGGWLIFNASQVFATKEECEKSLYIGKIANDMKDNNPKDVKIYARKCNGVSETGY